MTMVTGEKFISVPVDSVPTDITLPYPIYIKLSDKFIKLRAKGDVLDNERCKQLRQKNVEALYVDFEEWKGFLGTVEQAMQTVGVSDESKAAMGMRTTLDAYWRTVEESRAIEPALFGKLKELCFKIPGAMQKSRSIADMLLRHYNDPKLYFANHSVNVTVYSVAIGMKLGLPVSELQELALAACFANVGIIKIPREILYKPGGLSSEEWKEVRKHPQYGEEILKGLLAPKSAIATALYHHERQDGGGYTQGLRDNQIPLFARIVSVGEVFNALTSARPWAKPVAPHKAVEMMKQMTGKFDPALMQTI